MHRHPPAGRRSLGRRLATALPASGLLAATLLIACRGDDGTRADAAAVAGRFLAAVGAQRWDSAAAVVDSADARRFRDEQLGFLAGMAEHEQDIVRAMSASGSGGMASVGSALPLDTALVARHRAWPVRALDGEPTLGELAALPTKRFYARMYESPLNCWIPGRIRPVRIIGTVLDHDSVAYVVYERSSNGPDAEARARETTVLALTRSAGRWGVRPGMLEPHIDIIALLDTSVAGRAMMAKACGPKNR